MLRKPPDPPRGDPDELMYGVCQTCRQEVERRRRDTERRYMAGIDSPACECPGCKGCVFLLPKVVTK